MTQCQKTGFYNNNGKLYKCYCPACLPVHSCPICGGAHCKNPNCGSRY